MPSLLPRIWGRMGTREARVSSPFEATTTPWSSSVVFNGDSVMCG